MFPCNQSNIPTPFGIIIDPYINTQPYFNQQAPIVSAHQPPNFDVDWFFFDIDLKWKQFDWRRCNLLENMLHYCNQGEYQIVYRDILYIIDYEHMVMHHEDQYIKLRRETSIISKQVRLGTGKWSYYNGQTWVQYDKPIQQQLEDLMVRQEPVIMMICNGIKYVFDLEQNCEIQNIDEKGINKRKIITRQYMSTQQLQDFGRTRKTQEQNYMRERRILEDYMKSANHQKRKNKHYKKAPEQQQEESTSKLFKMIQLPQSPQIDPKKLEEWNLLIEQMKSEI